MASTIQCGRRTREDFGKIPSIVEIPNLIEIQKRSYEQFLQKDVAPERREETGLQAVFKSVFPIADYNDNALLEFDSYHFGDPKYTVEECHDRGMTFAIPLKVTLRLVVYDHDKEAKTRTIREQRGQEVYLGELPLMTDKGTFIINGTERVVVSQLQRSAGVFFDDDKGKTVASGKLLYSARVIPYRGSWVEFEFDANDILFVRVDRRRKMLATAFLRAFTFLEKGVIISDAEILGQFYDAEEVLSFEDRNAWVKLHAEAHNGVKVADDVKPPRHREPLVTAGKTLNPKLIEKLVEAGVTKIPVKADSLVGRRTADRVVDADTGEVLVETNQEMTQTILTPAHDPQDLGAQAPDDRARKGGRVGLRDAGPRSLQESGRGARRDLPAAPSRRSAHGGLGAGALPGHVHGSAPLRPGARGPFHDQQEARHQRQPEHQDAARRGRRLRHPAPAHGAARHQVRRTTSTTSATGASGRWASCWRTSSGSGSRAWSGPSRSGCRSPTSPT